MRKANTRRCNVIRRKWPIWMALFAWAFAMTAMPIACERRGPGERAGRDLDRATEGAGEAIQDLGEEIEDIGRGRR
jgi:hypothetical protein